jgi:hypothetical protein
VKELAQRWRFSVTNLTRIFAAEEGVVRLGSRSNRRRTKISTRIPKSVADRVYRRLSEGKE